MIQYSINDKHGKKMLPDTLCSPVEARPGSVYMCDDEICRSLFALFLLPIFVSLVKLFRFSADRLGKQQKKTDFSIYINRQRLYAEVPIFIVRLHGILSTVIGPST